MGGLRRLPEARRLSKGYSMKSRRRSSSWSPSTSRSRGISFRATSILTALFILLGATVLLRATPAASADEAVPVQRVPFQRVPASSVAVVYLPDGAAWVETWDRFELTKRLRNTEAWSTLSGSPEGLKLLGGIAVIESQFGKKLPEFLKSTLGGPWVLIKPQADEDTVVWARPRNLPAFRNTLERIGQTFFQNAESREVAGIPVRRFGGLWHTLRDGEFYASASLELLEAALEAENLSTDSIAPKFEKLSSSSLAHAYLNLESLRRVTPGPFKRFKSPSRQPLVSLLFGGFASMIADAREIEISLSARGQGLELHTQAHPNQAHSHQGHPIDKSDKKDSDDLSCFFPEPSGRQLNSISGLIGRVELHRDLAQWWDQRRSWVAKPGWPELEEFRTGLSTITGGWDVAEDFFPHIEPKIQLLAFAGEPPVGMVPEPELPNFALVFATEASSDFAKRLQLAFQTSISMINFEQNTNNRPPFLTESHSYRGVTLSRAWPFVPEEGVPAPGIEYNFRPAFALCEGHVIIASTDSAVKRLIDTLLDSKDNPKAQAPSKERLSNSGLTIRGPELLKVLAKNRAALVADEVLKGKSMAEAEFEIGALLELLSFFEEFDLSARRQDQRLDLELKLDMTQLKEKL